MKANRGFTLIELAVVLAIIAVLAAILTPLVTSYIDQARTTRAAADVRAIAQAAQLYKRDTGQYPIYADAANAALDNAELDLLSTGTTPTIVGAGWVLTSFGSMETFINQNQLGLPTNNPSRGRVAFRGPYLASINEDPWGNAYIIASDNLALASVNIAIAISAGPNGTLDTARDQAQTAALAVTGDDIAVRIN